MDDKNLQAKALLTLHDHEGTGTTLERSNCGACVLNGYGDKGREPNYSGWARIYVQANKIIPAKYREAFVKELRSENRAYAESLIDDIRDHGVLVQLSKRPLTN